MKVIYISGPYRAKTPYEILQNIERARKAAVGLWQEGWAVICPHSNTALFDGTADDSVWLKGDLEILRRCDAIYVLKGWRDSLGTCEEVCLALALDMEVIYE